MSYRDALLKESSISNCSTRQNEIKSNKKLVDLIKKDISDINDIDTVDNLEYDVFQVGKDHCIYDEIYREKYHGKSIKHSRYYSKYDYYNLAELFRIGGKSEKTSENELMFPVTEFDMKLIENDIDPTKYSYQDRIDRKRLEIVQEYVSNIKPISRTSKISDDGILSVTTFSSPLVGHIVNTYKVDPILSQSKSVSKFKYHTTSIYKIIVDDRDYNIKEIGSIYLEKPTFEDNKLVRIDDNTTKVYLSDNMNEHLDKSKLIRFNDMNLRDYKIDYDIKSMVIKFKTTQKITHIYIAGQKPVANLFSPKSKNLGRADVTDKNILKHSKQIYVLNESEKTGWVEKFQIFVKHNKFDWYSIGIYSGNYNQFSGQLIPIKPDYMIDNYVIADAIRIVPLEWNYKPIFRLAVYRFKNKDEEKDDEIVQTIDYELTLPNGGIKKEKRNLATTTKQFCKCIICVPEKNYRDKNRIINEIIKEGIDDYYSI